VFDNGFEAVAAAGGSGGAVAELAEGESEIVADDEDIFQGYFVEIDDGREGDAGEIVVRAGFNEESVVVLGYARGEFFAGSEGERMGASKKIESEEAEIVAGEVVLLAGVAEGENEVFHGVIVS